MRKLLSLMAVFVVSLMAVVSAIDAKQVEFAFVKVNDVDVTVDGTMLAVEEGKKLDLEVGLEGKADMTDIEVQAEIDGYEYSDYESLTAQSHVFDLAKGTTKTVSLELTLPKKLEKSEYLLKISVKNKDSSDLVKEIKLAVEPVRHGLDISDVAFSPGTTVKAGRSLLTTVLLQNYGDKDEKDVKVTVSIPALGVSATEFVDVISTAKHNIEYEDVPEMFVSIPATAQPGEYDVKVTAGYDEYESVTKTFKLNVIANELFQASDKLVLAVGPESQNVAVGQTATYAIALTNAGTGSKAYMVEVVTGDWANAKVSESLVVLESNKNQVVYVDVTPTSAAAVGSAQVASVAIKSGSDVLQTVSLKANVAGAAKQSVNLRNGLEIALIALVVLLVIIGLVIGFSRLKKDDEEKTYY